MVSGLLVVGYGGRFSGQRDVSMEHHVMVLLGIGAGSMELAIRQSLGWEDKHRYELEARGPDGLGIRPEE
jgi:hypothetical protein